MAIQRYRGIDAEIILDGTTVAVAQSASVEVAAASEAAYEIGSSFPVDIRSGNVEITGSLEKIGVRDPRFQFLTLGPDPATTTLAEFTLEFKLGKESGAPRFRATGCKFETGGVDIPQDGWITETMDFRAKSYELTTVASLALSESKPLTATEEPESSWEEPE